VSENPELIMKDDRLPPAALVPRSAVAAYPTTFAAMARSDFEAITPRGEQLMRTVLPMYLRPAHR
jgi:NTE family protein